MSTGKPHVRKLVFAKPRAGTVSSVSRANSEDAQEEDTGRLINAHKTAKGEVAAMQTVITADDTMPTVTIDNLDFSRLAIGFDRSSKTELHSGLELIEVPAAVRSSERLQKLDRSANSGCSETHATQKRSRKNQLGRTLAQLIDEFSTTVSERYDFLVVDPNIAKQFLLDSHSDLKTALMAYDTHLVEFHKARARARQQTCAGRAGYRESNPVVRLLDKRPVQSVTTADVAKLIVLNEKTSALAQAGQLMRVGRVADEIHDGNVKVTAATRSNGRLIELGRSATGQVRSGLLLGRSLGP